MEPSRLRGKLLDAQPVAEPLNRLQGKGLALAGRAAIASEEAPPAPDRYINRDSGEVYTVNWVTPREGRDDLVQLVGPDGTTINKSASSLSAAAAEEGGAWSRFEEPATPTESSD